MLSESELRGLLKSIVEALLYLRRANVIHGNVKASNILLTEDCRVVRHILKVSIGIILISTFSVQKLSGFELAERGTNTTRQSSPLKA